MASTFARPLCALLAAAGLAFALVPGCVIRIGPGGDPGSDTGTDADTSPTDPPDVQPEEPTQEEVATEALTQADQQQVAIARASAGYTAYLLQGAVESQGLDPNTVDVETIEQVVNDSLPWAQEETRYWISTQDPANLLTVVGSTTKPRMDCVYDPEFLCSASVHCDFADFCTIVDCGDGRCQPCPEIFGLNKLIIRSWCGYVCFSGSKVSGIAAVAWTKPFDYPIQVCLPDHLLW